MLIARIIVTIVVAAVGLYLSIEKFDKDEIQKTVRRVGATIIIGIATNLIWSGIQELIYREASDEVSNEDDIMDVLTGQPTPDVMIHSTTSSIIEPIENQTEESANNQTSHPTSVEMLNPSTAPIHEIVTPSETKLDIAANEEKACTIEPYLDAEIIGEDVAFLNYSGYISTEDQEDVYTFVAPVSGWYRCELSNIVSGFKVSIILYDSEGYVVDSKYRAGDGGGITVKLVGNNEYRLVIQEEEGIGAYGVIVGQQKEKINISDYTIVKDSTEFAGQENEYLYTAKVSGTYRFWISQINSGVYVSVYVFDAAGYLLEYKSNASEGGGVTVELENDQTYSVIVEQSTGFNDYTLSIGVQKTIMDATEYSVILDSIQFRDQINNYAYTAKISGTYRFWISRINSGVYVSIYMYDAAGYLLDCRSSASEGGGITVTLEAGKTYLMEVRQSTGYDNYTISIGAQKGIVDISKYMIVNDSIQFRDQENIYTYIPEKDGSYELLIKNTTSGNYVSIYVYDDAGYVVDYRTGMDDGKSLDVDLEANRKYTIVAEYSSGEGPYTLSINCHN